MKLFSLNADGAVGNPSQVTIRQCSSEILKRLPIILFVASLFLKSPFGDLTIKYVCMYVFKWANFVLKLKLVLIE